MKRTAQPLDYVAVIRNNENKCVGGTNHGLPLYHAQPHFSWTTRPHSSQYGLPAGAAGPATVQRHYAAGDLSAGAVLGGVDNFVVGQRHGVLRAAGEQQKARAAPQVLGRRRVAAHGDVRDADRRQGAQSGGVN